MTSRRSGNKDDEEKEKLSDKLKKVRKYLKKRWKEFRDKAFFIVAVFYAVYDSTSRASMLGAGRCSECMDDAVMFGMLVAAAIIVPIVLIALKRCRARIVKRYQKIRAGKRGGCTAERLVRFLTMCLAL